MPSNRWASVPYGISCKRGHAIGELKPGSDDERSDASKLDRDKLTRVAIHDTQIARELARFRDHSQTRGRPLFLEIVHKESRYKFHAELELGEYESVIYVGATLA